MRLLIGDKIKHQRIDAYKTYERIGVVISISKKGHPMVRWENGKKTTVTKGWEKVK